MLKTAGLGDLYRRAQIFRNMNQGLCIHFYLRLGEKLSMIQNSFKGVFVNKVETVNSYLDYPDSLEKHCNLPLSVDTVRMPARAKYLTQPPPRPVPTANWKEQNGIHLMDRAAQDLINEVHGRPRCQRDINGLLSGQRHERRFCSLLHP